jgi:hypothetical protein
MMAEGTSLLVSIPVLWVQSSSKAVRNHARNPPRIRPNRMLMVELLGVRGRKRARGRAAQSAAQPPTRVILLILLPMAFIYTPPLVSAL